MEGSQTELAGRQGPKVAFHPELERAGLRSQAQLGRKSLYDHLAAV